MLNTEARKVARSVQTASLSNDISIYHDYPIYIVNVCVMYNSWRNSSGFAEVLSCIYECMHLLTMVISVTWLQGQHGIR